MNLQYSYAGWMVNMNHTLSIRASCMDSRVQDEARNVYSKISRTIVNHVSLQVFDLNGMNSWQYNNLSPVYLYIHFNKR